MSDIIRKYRCRYIYSRKPGGVPRHSYELIGAKGGLHLHIDDLRDLKGAGVDYTAGLECHWRVPPDYMADQPPHFDECWLLKCPCWHDGTTTWAEEHFLPRFRQGYDPEQMFELLREDAERQFERDPS